MASAGEHDEKTMTVLGLSSKREIYVANTYDHTSAETGTVSVVNGATCDATHISGCASQIALLKFLSESIRLASLSTR